MTELEMLRKKIQETDEAIIKMLAERQALSKKIGRLKTKLGKEIIDLDREQALVNHYEQLSIANSLEPALVKRIFKMIILASRKLQKNEPL